MQDGYARLPDIAITDKNDTFHLRGESYGTFRLMARVVKRDMYGNLVPIEGVAPAISKKFIVGGVASLSMPDTTCSLQLVVQLYNVQWCRCFTLLTPSALVPTTYSWGAGQNTTCSE